MLMQKFENMKFTSSSSLYDNDADKDDDKDSEIEDNNNHKIFNNDTNVAFQNLTPFLRTTSASERDFDQIYLSTTNQIYLNDPISKIENNTMLNDQIVNAIELFSSVGISDDSAFESFETNQKSSENFTILR